MLYQQYEVLPPETNSDNIYADPGPILLVEAANTWKHVGEQMDSVLISFTDVLRALADQWSSESATRLAEAVGPFRDWWQTLIDTIHQVAKETFHIAQAYCSARDGSVHPLLVAKIRVQAERLAANDQLGLNAPTIADLEQRYRMYWKQDVKAMRVYDAAVVEALEKMTPWAPPPSITAS